MANHHVRRYMTQLLIRQICFSGSRRNNFILIRKVEDEKGQCPMAIHVAIPNIDTLRYGISIPGNPQETAIFGCPNVSMVNVFKVEVEER